MKMFTYKEFISAIKIALLAGVLLVGLNFVSAAWSGPTEEPPGGNTPTPVNVGTESQVKSAGLGLDALSVFGDSLITGTETVEKIVVNEICLGGECITSWGDTPSAQAPTVTLEAVPSSVEYNGSTVLGWISTNSTECSAPWTSSTNAVGFETIDNLTSNQEYSITCTGSGGSKTDSTTVTVGDEPVTYNSQLLLGARIKSNDEITYYPKSVSVDRGDKVRLEMFINDVNSCTSNFFSTFSQGNNTTQTYRVSPDFTTEYKVRCKRLDNNDYRTRRVNVKVNQIDIGYNRVCPGGICRDDIDTEAIIGTKEARYNLWINAFDSSNVPINLEVTGVPAGVSCRNLPNCGPRTYFDENITSKPVLFGASESAVPGVYSIKFKAWVVDSQGNTHTKTKNSILRIKDK